jgi:hypothetical protein
MFDSLTGLSTNNSWVSQLTQPDGLNTFNVNSLFGAPLGSGDNAWWWNPTSFNISSPLGTSNTSWFWNTSPTDFGITSPGNSIGTGNYIADQSIGLINGLLNGGGGFGLAAIANQGTVLTGGLQALPQPVNGVPNFF